MSDRDVVRHGYDEIAETYAARRDDDGRDVAVLETFLDALPETVRILDAGCGAGTPVLARLRASRTAVGLDVSREQLRLAAEAVAGPPLVQGEMAALPFGADTFDAVTAFHSLIHVPLADHLTVLEEFARVLGPGGRVLLTEGSTRWSGRNDDWLDTGVEMRWDVAGAEATRSHLEAAGFAVVEEWTVADDLADDEDASDPFFSARLVE